LLARRQLMDEFEDVAVEEKAVMKMWNRHILNAPYERCAHSLRCAHRACCVPHCAAVPACVCVRRSVNADWSMAAACESFVAACGPAIVRDNLRANVLLHIINLWDNALVDGATVARCTAALDAVCAAAAAGAGSLLLQ
jgi:hypothetical protein